MKYLKFCKIYTKYILRLIFDFSTSYYVYYFSLKKGYFDPSFYKKNNNLLIKNKYLIFLHYFFKGYLKLKSPSQNFSTVYYYSLFPDAEQFKVNPLSHYFFNIKSKFPSIDTKFNQNFNKEGYIVPINQSEQIKYQNEFKPVVKLYALYLPQFHEDELNNKFWGKGFTEWTNVKKTQQKFPGHEFNFTPKQGYYSLDNIEEIERQCKLAKDHGITGFCIFLYDFGNDITPLYKIVPELIKTIKKYELEFSFMWANEPWTRTWDGLENNKLIEQNKNIDDQQIDKMIKRIIDFVKLDNYQSIDGKKIFHIYRPDYFINNDKLISSFKNNFRKYGIDISLIAANTFSLYSKPELLNQYDFIIDYPPHPNNDNSSKSFFRKYKSHMTFCYEKFYLLYNKHLEKIKNSQKRWIPNIFPSWDNSPRKLYNANIFINSNEKTFKKFLVNSIDYEIDKNFEDKFLYINAWNEWGEGSNLEPDDQNGYWKLNSISEILNNYQSMFLNEDRDFKNDNKKIVIAHIFYLKDFERLIQMCKKYPKINFFTTFTSAKIDFNFIKSIPAINNLIFKSVTNKGRDVRSLIESLPILKKRNYIVKGKIHFKRKKSKGGKKISYKLTLKYIDDILDKIDSIDNFEKIDNQIYCHKEYILNHYFYYGVNESKFHDMINMFGLPIRKSIFKPFLAGGNYIFVDKENSLENFIEQLDPNQFNYDDEYYLDGKYEHSIERMIGPYFLFNDFKLVKI